MSAEGSEVDLLVRELMAGPRPPVAKAPSANRPGAALHASRPTSAFASIASADDPMPREPQVSRGWSNVRLLMPSRRQSRADWRAAVATVIGVARQSRPVRFITQFLHVPGPVALVRMWVGLGVVYSASLAFWPFPKTYLWGLVLYVLCLGLMLVSGVWGARLSWHARLGAAHTVALATVFWAVGLAAAETLPPQ